MPVQTDGVVISTLLPEHFGQFEWYNNSILAMAEIPNADPVPDLERDNPAAKLALKYFNPNQRDEFELLYRSHNGDIDRAFEQIYGEADIDVTVKNILLGRVILLI